MANRPTQSGGGFMMVLAVLLGGLGGGVILGGLGFYAVASAMPVGESQNQAALIAVGILALAGFAAGGFGMFSIWKKARED